MTRIIITDIIKKYNLSPSQCIIFNVRNQNKIQIKKLTQPSHIFPYVENHNYSKMLILLLTFLFRVQLYFLHRGEFTLYAPNYAVMFVRIMSVLNSCKCLCQIEDGSVNYRYNVEECKKMFFVKSKGRFKFLFDSSGLINNSCQRYFAINELAFQGEINKILIFSELQRQQKQLLNKEQINVCILGPNSKSFGMKENELLIKRFLLYCNQKQCEAYFKFHPNYTNKEKRALMNFIQSTGLAKINIIDEIIELSLINGNPIVIHSLNSTLLIYQYLFTKTKGWCYLDINNTEVTEALNFFRQFCNVMR